MNILNLESEKDTINDPDHRVELLGGNFRNKQEIVGRFYFQGIITIKLQYFIILKSSLQIDFIDSKQKIIELLFIF